MDYAVLNMLESREQNHEGPTPAHLPCPDEFASAEACSQAAEDLFLAVLCHEVAEHTKPVHRDGNPDKRLVVKGSFTCSRAVPGFVAVTIHHPTTLDKQPNQKTKFANQVVIVRRLGVSGPSNIVYAICDTAAKANVILRMKDSAFTALNQGGELPTTGWLVAPIMDIMFQQKAHCAIQRFRALPNALFEVPSDDMQSRGALHSFIRPASGTPFPLKTDVNAWRPPANSAPLIAAWSDEQRAALAVSASTPYGLVLLQGPPGTGKSHVIVRGLIPLAVQRQRRVLVVANANTCVDDVLMSFKAACPNVRVARLGYRDGIRAEVIQVPGLLCSSLVEAAEAQVVFTTIYHCSKLCGEASPTQGHQFDEIILEEAGCLFDIQLMAALAAAGGEVRTVTLVGDHKQLPPIDQGNGHANVGPGHSRSCLQRAADAVGARPGLVGRLSLVMLREQHRMAPAIRALVSELSYGNQLREAPVVTRRQEMLRKGCALDRHSLIVLDLDYGTAKFQVATQSKLNVEEADAAIAVYRALEAAQAAGTLGLPETSEPFSTRVGITSTFVAHRIQMEAAMRNVSPDAVVDYSQHTQPRAQVVGECPTVATVHAFQGAERDIIICSPCDAESKFQTQNLLNVAWSRAKYLLIIVGQVTLGCRATDVTVHDAYTLARDHAVAAHGLYPVNQPDSLERVLAGILTTAPGTPAEGLGGLTPPEDGAGPSGQFQQHATSRRALTRQLDESGASNK